MCRSGMPESLLIVDRDVAMLDQTRARLWESTVDALRNNSVFADAMMHEF
jgi:hypothetical protein